MFPPVYRKKVADAAVKVGIGSDGWAAYRRVLRQLHTTFVGNLELITAGRNEARQGWALRRGVAGSDLAKCVEEADQAVVDLKLVVPAYEDETDATKFNYKVTTEQLGLNTDGTQGFQFYTPEDLSEKKAELHDQEERAAKGQQLKSYKLKVKCM
eukprot:Rhum_TRINITY_DN4044_c0_g2::Rhum_TRINITY_DN4044_c0_g2_i1::g.12693::m.12693